ncbi:MAG: hypothetical protein GY698_08495 [Actinomycetia bacterium]|nr:hypothetical protein [Actinomycetes bacterium]
MDIRCMDENRLAIEVSVDELNMLPGGLREALEALDDWEFSTRMGVEPVQVEELAGALRAARDNS